MKVGVRQLTTAWALLLGSVFIAGAIVIAAYLLSQRLHPRFEFLLMSDRYIVVTDAQTGTAWICEPQYQGEAPEPSDCPQTAPARR
jgi:hypothetical protein